MATLVNLESTGGISRLSFQRPDVRNALSIAMLAEAIDAVASLPVSTAVLVITGEGRCFCAGMDLKAILDDPTAPRRLLGSLGTLTLRLRELPCPVIARVNGAAIGGGCGLACVADFTVTHADSKMGFPEVDLGVCPAVVAPWVVRRVGAGAARRILLAGGLMSGREAFEAGLATHLVETREELDGAVNALAAKLASGGAKAMAATKGLLNDLDGSRDAALLERAAALSAEVIAGPEAQAMLRKARGS